MKYRYLITSQYANSNGVGFTEDCITMTYKLNTIENINRIREEIKKRYGFDTLVILNIMRLKK